MGSVVRVETAWPTIESPLARSCCLQVIFICNAPKAADALPRAKPEIGNTGLGFGVAATVYTPHARYATKRRWTG